MNGSAGCKAGEAAAGSLGPGKIRARSSRPAHQLLLRRPGWPPSEGEALALRLWLPDKPCPQQVPRQARVLPELWSRQRPSSHSRSRAPRTSREATACRERGCLVTTATEELLRPEDKGEVEQRRWQGCGLANEQLGEGAGAGGGGVKSPAQGPNWAPRAAACGSPGFRHGLALSPGLQFETRFVTS